MKLFTVRPRLFAVLALLALILSAFTPAAVNAQAPAGAPSQTIVEIAAANPNLSTLVAAVKAAGLVDNLNSPGPFTVFAPTNAAFNQLPKGTLDALLNDPAALKNVMLYHVLGSEVLAKDAAKAGHATTLNGQDVVISTCRGLHVNHARIVVRDVLATNGVIHVIDAVLLPPSQDIVDSLASKPEFSTLVTAVKAAGLVDTLNSPGPFTVFAPTNAAFDQLPKGTLDALLKDPTALKNVLLYHVIAGKVYSAEARNLTSATMANGATVKIHIDGRHLMINNAQVIHANELTTNGVIHVIDTVLIPPK
jgi:transforming growth factor-beta-induced protein